MVRLASIDHKGVSKLVAQVDDGAAYVDLASIGASNSRAFFETDSAVAKANELIASVATTKIPAAEARLLIPLDPSTCG